MLAEYEIIIKHYGYYLNVEHVVDKIIHIQNIKEGAVK
jgi:hypothetical protein